MTAPDISRRLGATPQERGSVGNGSCPDLFELSDGRIAVIGTDMTADLDGKLPDDASRAEYEKIVVITRDTLLRARPDIAHL
ncbi:hypothetical protein [Streptomyces sp. NPDC052496]|uniref:hypothetical protein n=1 Tax=Streptomyces sp. NPDC052496 TaxID=3154951 RepID=UPI0034196329